MIMNRASVICCSVALSLSGSALVPAVAGATERAGTESGRIITPVAPLRLADVVVNGSAPSAPAPAAAPVVVQPQSVAAPVVQAPAPRATIVEHETHNYMTTIAVSALMGGLAGVLVGGSLYYLSDNRTHGTRVGYWAAGGVLVGTGVGLTQVFVQESRADRATATTLPTDPAPTFRLALYQTRF